MKKLDLSIRFSGWGDAAFIVGLVFSSSLVEYAMVGSLMDFLRNAWEEKLPYAAATVNVQSGLVGLMAFGGAFLTDAYLGRYRMVLLSTITYILGLGLFTVSASPLPKRGPEAASIFYTALVLISIGQGGYKPSLKVLGSDQMERKDDPNVEKGRTQAWWYTGTFFGMGVGLIVAAVLNDENDWKMAGTVSTAVMVAALIIFLCRKPFYAIPKPCGCLLQRVSRVLIAAAVNRNADHPTDADQLYEIPQPSNGDQLLPHTDSRPRCLEKAAIRLSSDAAEEGNINWRQCTVTQVEEAKILLGMFPIWTTCLMYGLVKAMGSTFFFEQAISMDRKIGKITVPLTSLLAFSSTSKILVSQFLVPLVELFAKLERGIPPLMKIGAGMFFSIICCSCASVVEHKRLKMIKKLDPVGGVKLKKVPMNVFWLLPQFCMLGAMDGLMSDGLEEFFENSNHVPDSMKSFGPSFFQSVIGVGSLLSAILIVVSTEVSKRGGNICWIGNNVSDADSHLDYFYRTFSVLSYVNLCVYMCISSVYGVKKEKMVNEELGNLELACCQ